ncbi:hypothetical protein E5329_19410 [Petralouisia muris]|jgi:hypothetical protein|uniref:Uncharacterized protein n=1 Tax=Petralouisia muris TaxID=3032872 RepID=A0AC61RSN7_9FIRM|nr:hypothetical protein [Petralouisia muris]TGY92618.1 hypothetical protein E5329_19410 [Petralouisia muris]
MMEEELRRLFDFQKFSENLRLAEMLDETEKRYGEALSDEELEQVNAAGEFAPFESREDNSDD